MLESRWYEVNPKDKRCVLTDGQGIGQSEVAQPSVHRICKAELFGSAALEQAIRGHWEVADERSVGL